jgi:hypothetical protein
MVSEGTAGLMEISLHKDGRQIKNIRFMREEWEDLVRQIILSESEDEPYTDPILVVVARYRRLHNAGANCTPIANLLETIAQIREDPDGFVRKEKLEKMMEIVVKIP